MDYRYLGRSALKVSPLCLGTMMFGGATDEPTARRIIDKARDQGINFIDTADAYNGGKSEEVVGRAIGAHRDHWVLATKFGQRFGPGPNEGGQSRKWIVQDVENSLRKLGTDHIDILYFHRSDNDAPFEEGLRAIRDLIAQGKLRYYGVSNFRGWRIAEICRAADAIGMDRPIVSQPLYNMVDRLSEVEQLPAAGHCGLGVVPYSPLARGVLSGKYASDAPPPPDSRAGRGDVRMQQTEWRPNPSPSPGPSPPMRPRAGWTWSASRSPGCCATASSPPPSPARAPKRSGTAICPRSRPGWARKTRLSSMPSSPPATPPPPATPTPPIPSKAGSRACPSSEHLAQLAV